MEENTVQYPLFYKCQNAAEWQQLEQQANELLELPSPQNETYSKPIIDKHNAYWFVVGLEVAQLLQGKELHSFDAIETKGL